MKAVSVTTIKKELAHLPEQELVELCLTLAKFKKENKELLTYLLFERQNEDRYTEQVKAEMESQLKTLNTASFFYMKKTIRKILRLTKKYIRYSKKEETEVRLLLHFCKMMKDIKPSYTRDKAMTNLFDRQVLSIEKGIAKLHEDLQYDYNQKLNRLLSS